MMEALAEFITLSTVGTFAVIILAIIIAVIGYDWGDHG